ncbi:MAG: hypothetical protein WBP13_00150 [Methylophilaceae bacterium]
MTDQKSHDAHLKTALDNAPDDDALPNAQVRKAVLDYAKLTIKPQQSWLSRIKNWLIKDHFANTQWAGLTSLSAVFLVTILLWRQHPENVVGVSDVPVTIPESAEIAQKQPDATLKKEAAPAVVSSAEITQAEITQDQAAPADTKVETKSVPAPLPQAETQQTAKSKSIEIAQSELAKSEQERSEREFSRQLKDEKIAAEADKKSNTDAATLQPSAKKVAKEKINTANAPAPTADMPMASAPAPMAAAAPAIVAESAAPNDDATQVAPAKNKAMMPGATQTSSADKLEGNIETNNNANVDSATQTEKRRKGISSLATKIVQIGGKALAFQDIQAGNMQLLALNMLNSSAAVCEAKQEKLTEIDTQTGLPILIMDVCHASEPLTKEVELYNQTMKDWQLKQAN